MNESRRQFINRCVSFSTGLAGTIFLLQSCGQNKPDAGAGKPVDTIPPPPVADPCKDFTGVTEEELEKRKKMGYIEKSELPNSSCGNCGLYIPFAEKKECGKCLLFKGPVYAEGHCLQWVAKTQ